MTTSRWKRFAPIAVLVVWIAGLLPQTQARAVTATTGTIVAYGTFTAYGLTTSPLGTTPLDWATGPYRNWSLDSYPTVLTPSGPCVTYRPGSTKDMPRTPFPCTMQLRGEITGWCDLSKGVGYGSYTAPGSKYEWGNFRQLHWSGAGRTLAVTGEMEAYASGPVRPGLMAGTVVGTVTLLDGTGWTLLDLCTDPDGVQTPIPVLVELEYVLQ